VGDGANGVQGGQPSDAARHRKAPPHYSSQSTAHPSTPSHYSSASISSSAVTSIVPRVDRASTWVSWESGWWRSTLGRRLTKAGCDNSAVVAFHCPPHRSPLHRYSANPAISSASLRHCHYRHPHPERRRRCLSRDQDLHLERPQWMHSTPTPNTRTMAQTRTHSLPPRLLRPPPSIST
jgi:hypothetical protein